MSISVCSNMCPMCSEPVTLGGGITIENTGPGALGSALNSSSFTQYSAQRGSICCGSYAFAISRAIQCGSPGKISAQLLHARPFFFRVIFDYTGAKPVASIRRIQRHQMPLLLMNGKLEAICEVPGGELRLLGLQLFLDHRFHDRLQDLSRHRLQNFGTHLGQDFGHEVVQVSRWLRCRCLVDLERHVAAALAAAGKA